MIALAQRHIPCLTDDVTGIEWVGQNAIGLLVRYVAVARLGKLRMQFEKAPDFGLRSKATAGVALQPLLNDGGVWFIAHKGAAAARIFLIAKTEWGIMHIEAPEHSRPHAVFRLLAVLLPLMLSKACHQIFVENAIRIGAELPAGRFERRPRRVDQFLQIKMVAHIPRHAAHVVYNDDDFLPAVLADELEHRIEAGPPGKLTGYVVIEHVKDLMAATGGIFAAASGLGL